MKFFNNKYIMIDKIGEGSSGVVYKAKDSVTGKNLAIKIFSRDKYSFSARKFKNEFALIKSLNHPNIVSVYDFGTITKPGLRYFFTMDYIEGDNIVDYMQKAGTKKSYDLLYDIIVQTCRALEYIHTKGLIHYDIKPENILVTKNKTVKLLDFGLAEEHTYGTNLKIKGTPLYVAPEIIKGSNADSRADLYSFGCVLYEAFTGEPPFKGKNTISILKQHLDTKVSVEKVPATMRNIITKLLEKNSSERFQNTNDIILELNNITGKTFKTETIKTSESHIVSAKLTGREKELTFLKNILENVGNKENSSFVLVGGETGSGKTRLLQEIKCWAQLRNINVFMDKCLDSSIPYYGISNILQEMVCIADSKSLKNYAYYINKVLGKSLIKADKNDGKNLQEESKSLFFNKLSKFIKKCSGVIIIEDLNYCDKITLEFLEYLTENLAGSNIIIIGSYNTDNLKNSKFFYKTLSIIREKKYFKEVIIQPLSKKDAFLFISSILGKPFIEKYINLLNNIYSLTKGNCLFIEEYLKMLVKKNLIQKLNNLWEIKEKELSQINTPNTIKSLLTKKLSLIDDEDIKLLKYAAVIGDEFNIYLLQMVTGEKLKTIIYRLRQTELLREKGMDTYEFRSAELRQLLYKRIPPVKRKSIHNKIGNLLEKEQEKDSHKLAYHFIKSNSEEKAFKYGIIAACDSSSKYAYEEEIFLCKQLLVLIRSPAKRSEIFGRLGYAQFTTGKIEEAIKSYKEVLRYNVIKPKYIVDKCITISECYEIKGKHKKAEEYIWRAEKILKENGINNPVVSLKKSWTLILKGEHKQAIFCLESLKRKIKNNLDFAFTLYHMLSIVYRLKGEYGKSKKSILKALKLAEKSKNMYSEIICINSIAILFDDRGEYRKSKKYFEKSLEYSEKIKYKTGIGYTLNNIGELYIFNGNYISSLKCLNKSIELAKKLEDKRLLIMALNSLSVLYENKGESKKAIKYVMESLEISREKEYKSLYISNLINCGEYYNYIGEFSKSLKYLNEAHILSEKTEIPILYYIVLSKLYGNIFCVDKAMFFAEKALKIIEKLATKKDLARTYNSLARCLMFLENYEEAEKHLIKSLQIVKKTGEFFYEYMALLLLARVYIKENNYEQAWEKIKQISKLKIDSRQLKGEFLYLKGILLLIENSTEAIKYFSKAEELIKDIGSIELLWELYASMADFYEKNENYPKSAFYYKKSNEILTKISNNINDKELKKCFFNDTRKKEIVEKMKKLKELSSQPVIEQLSQPHLVKLYEILQIVNSVLGFNEILDKTMDIVIEILKAERGLIILVDKTTGMPEVKTARNMDKQTIIDATSISNSIIKGVSQKGKPVFTRDASADPEFNCRKSVVLNRIKSIMCVPLKIRDVIIGTIYTDTRNISNLFSEEDTRFLTAFANQVVLTIENARLREKLMKDVEYFKRKEEKKYKFANIIGNSSKMQKVYELIENVANVDSTVLIEGTTGTGKEMVAGAIHYSGTRKNNKFIPLACGALPEHLLESELFGHKKGSFTGAIEDKKGLFEEAEGGTLFLDDVVNLSPGIQAKLLRVLDSGEIRRVGETKTRKVNVRILAATNINIENEVKKGKFREDLFYRLNVVTIKIPSLKERKEDIPVLADYFLKKYSKSMNKKIKGFSKEAIELLCFYDWPGNVRELEHEIEKIVVLIGNKEQIITEKMLSTRESIKKQGIETTEPLEKAVDNMERNYIKKILEKNKGNKLKAAKELGINRTTLHKKLKKLNI